MLRGGRQGSGGGAGEGMRTIYREDRERVREGKEVPPERLTILSDTGSVLSGVIGPYPVGGNLILHCRAEGGECNQLGGEGRNREGGGAMEEEWRRRRRRKK
ncbi:hypothetical protein Pcinc_019971 [Petrolisthes cinctipes]|uniref:Uncharacterized protein n=1 Tax=Petrolisthes cinctipes TaxID=88211 RepID=A0AAE1KJN2_PETCI|nr:hypothetical protein Pcinc_019971 [Petrolisthes cinctipes]